MEVATTWTENPDSTSRVARLTALVHMSHLDEAIEDLTPPAGTSGVPAHDEPWPQWWLFGCRATALLYSGRLGEAEELIVLADRQFIDHPAAEAKRSSRCSSPTFIPSRAVR